MEKLRNTRILALVGIIALVLGTIMPYITVSVFGYSDSISLWGYWEGKLIVVLAVANLLFIFKDFVEKYIPQLFNTTLGRKIKNLNNPKFSLIPTVLVAVFAIYLYNKLDLDAISKYLKYGLGFWSLWIGVISLVAHAILYKYPVANIQQNTQQQPMNYNYNQQSTQQQPMQQDNNIPQTGVKICPACGNKCDANTNKCFMCGNQI